MPATPYYQATRHPWCCLWFVLPLLVLYELGVFLLAPTDPLALRNGADSWINSLLEQLGLGHSLWPALFLVVILAGWSWQRRQDRPTDLAGTLAGMLAESMVFAVLLWILGRSFGPLLSYLGVPLQMAGQPDPTVARLVSFLGAGIYEEALFRLLLFSGLWTLFRLADVPEPGAMGLAVICSALAFAAAHNLGPAGEPFDLFRFSFRSCAGAYFALLFRARGFGISVGAHTGYDVLVGIILPTGSLSII